MSKEICFEDAMKRLDAIVVQMEQGNITLDESLALFEEGTALVKLCSQKLDDAELRVVRLMKDRNGEPVEMEMDHDE